MRLADEGMTRRNRLNEENAQVMVGSREFVPTPNPQSGGNSEGGDCDGVGLVRRSLLAAQSN